MIQDYATRRQIEISCETDSASAMDNDILDITYKVTLHTDKTISILFFVKGAVKVPELTPKFYYDAGHAQTSTTTNIYSHAIRSADVMAAEVLDDILKPKGRSEYGIRVV